MNFDLSKVEFSKKDTKRNLLLPEKPSEDLAEFMGILTGDGYMNFYPEKYAYVIEISGHSKKDLEYHETHIKVLMKHLFNILPRSIVKKGQQSRYLCLMSKGVFNFLLKIGFKKGKKESIGIPRWIKTNEKYARSFIRGLADTDCSLCIKKRYKSRPYYPVISIVSKSKKLLSEVHTLLKTFGFTVGNLMREERKDKRGYNDSVVFRVSLNGDKNLVRWMQIIGFKNPKHLINYSIWENRKWEERDSNPRRHGLQPCALLSLNGEIPV